MKNNVSKFLLLGFGGILVSVALQNNSLAADEHAVQIQQPPKVQLKEGEVLTPEIPIMPATSGVPTSELTAEPPLAAAEAGISACSLCYTCGGNWPLYSGTIGKLTPGSSYTPKERGASCSGSLEYREDDHPYLCCRAL